MEVHEIQMLQQGIQNAIADGLRDGFASLPKRTWARDVAVSCQAMADHSKAIANMITERPCCSVEVKPMTEEIESVKAERNAANVLLRQFMRVVEKDVMQRGRHPVRPNAPISLREQAKQLLSHA